MQQTNNSPQLRGLGAASLPGRHADFVALAVECDGINAPNIDLSRIAPLMGRGPKGFVGGSTFLGRDPLAAAFVYRLALGVSRGLLPVAKAVEMARTERAKGIGRVPASIVAAATGMISEYKNVTRNARAPNLSELEVFQQDQILATLPESSAAVAGELLRLGFGQGPERDTPMIGLGHWLKSGDWNRVALPSNLLDRIPAAEQPVLVGGMADTVHGSPGYAAHLIRAMGVPLGDEDLTALPKEQRAMWTDDPSFDSKLGPLFTGAVAVPQVVRAMESKVDAMLLA